jgi:hypothetical protein
MPGKRPPPPAVAVEAFVGVVLGQRGAASGGWGASCVQRWGATKPLCSRCQVRPPCCACPRRPPPPHLRLRDAAGLDNVLKRRLGVTAVAALGALSVRESERQAPGGGRQRSAGPCIPWQFACGQQGTANARGIASPERASYLIPRAVDELLLAEGAPRASLHEPRALERAGGRERPAAAALGLPGECGDGVRGAGGGRGTR